MDTFKNFIIGLNFDFKDGAAALTTNEGFAK